MKLESNGKTYVLAKDVAAELGISALSFVAFLRNQCAPARPREFYSAIKIGSKWAWPEDAARKEARAFQVIDRCKELYEKMMVDLRREVQHGS